MPTKKKSNKKPGAKTKPNPAKQNQEERGWRDVLVWIVPLIIGFLLTAVSIIYSSRRWLAVLTAIAAGIVFIAYFLFLAEWYVWRDRNLRTKMRCLFGVLAFCIVIVGGFWVYRLWTQTPQPFLVRMPAAPFGSYKSERGGVFWAIYNRGNGDIVTPAQLGLYIEIVNQRPRMALIDSYVVEAQNARREWFKLIRLEASSTEVFFCIDDLHKAKPLDLSNGLDRQLKDKAILPFATVKGWAFFELPQDIREGSPYRITVEDNTGASVTDNEEYNPPRPQKDYTQAADLKLAAGLKDLSVYRFRMYSELFKERIPN